jgi:hypothetical protein
MNRKCIQALKNRRKSCVDTEANQTRHSKDAQNAVALRFRKKTQRFRKKRTAISEKIVKRGNRRTSHSQTNIFDAKATKFKYAAGLPDVAFSNQKSDYGKIL